MRVTTGVSPGVDPVSWIPHHLVPSNPSPQPHYTTAALERARQSEERRAGAPRSEIQRHPPKRFGGPEEGVRRWSPPPSARGLRRRHRSRTSRRAGLGGEDGARSGPGPVQERVPESREGRRYLRPAAAILRWCLVREGSDSDSPTRLRGAPTHWGSGGREFESHRPDQLSAAAPSGYDATCPAQLTEIIRVIRRRPEICARPELPTPSRIGSGTPIPPESPPPRGGARHERRHCSRLLGLQV